MQVSQGKVFTGTPFRIVAETVINKPGQWDSEKVSIFRDNVLIGEYLRNYGNGTGTFYPFRLDNQWYALYSASYTALRVMKLHDDHIEDWCGEDPNPNGFCPMDLYVPQYHTMIDSYGTGDNKTQFEYFVVDNEDEFVESSILPTRKETLYCNFGFIGGCVWGDDSSMKLRFIDLAMVSEKELTITEKFGYWEVPNKMELRDAVDMSNWEPGHNWITLSKMEHFNIKNGEHC